MLQKLLQMLDEFRALLTAPTLLLTPELASVFERTGHRGERPTSGKPPSGSCDLRG